MAEDRLPPAVPNNILVTGPPRSGKTTVVERSVERLDAAGLTVGGVVAPEIREAGERVGFALEDVLGGERTTMAHVDRESGPSVGKYRVNVAAVDDLCAQALPRAREVADAVAVDEIAPMEVESAGFVREVRRALDADVPAIAAVHYRSTTGFVGEVKERADADVVRVTPETRDDLPADVARRVREELERDEGA